MEKIKRDFFHIEEKMLPKDQEIFPFHLYIYNPYTKKYTSYLYANSPMSEDRKEILVKILSKGGVLAIPYGQKQTFLTAADILEHHVPSLLEPETHALIRQREERLVQLQENKAKGELFGSPQDIVASVARAVKEENFLPFIEQVRQEILVFKVNISNTTSLAIKFAEKLMNQDNSCNRVVALSFALARLMGIKGDEKYGDLVSASFLHHLGQTQYDREEVLIPVHKMSDDKIKQYKKHPGLSHHLIRKSGIALSDRAIKIILEHHERVDGSGFPYMKTGANIEPLALILGLVGHAIELSEGRITGEKIPLSKVARGYALKTISPGYDFQFGGPICDNFAILLGETLGEDEVDQAA